MRNSRNKANMAKHKNLNFCAYHSFGNSSSCITAVKWDARDVENTAGNARRCHPDHQNSFISVTGLKSSYGKISSPLTEISVGKNEISGTEPARSLIQTHRSVFGLGKWYANSRTGKCRPGIAVTISTNQFHLPKNDHEWRVVRYTQILLKMALKK